MRASRGMGAIAPSKMPKGKVIHRKDNPDAVDLYKKGGKVGLYANIHAKRERMAAGSGEKMRKRRPYATALINTPLQRGDGGGAGRRANCPWPLLGLAGGLSCRRPGPAA